MRNLASSMDLIFLKMVLVGKGDLGREIQNITATRSLLRMSRICLAI